MIALISDIHANHMALLAVLDKLDELGADQIFCLGDIGGYYCEINECCNTLRQRGVFSLMGNHDWYLVSDQKCNRSNSVNRCIEYQKSIISAENLAWLRTLKSAVQIGDFNLVHGGWADSLEEYIVPSERYFSEIEGRHFASGHTHVPIVWNGRDKSYCNPGSVGQPRDGDWRASFATWDGREFSLHRVEYDYSGLQVKMREAGFEAYFYENLENGTRLGGKIDSVQLID